MPQTQRQRTGNARVQQPSGMPIHKYRSFPAIDLADMYAFPSPTQLGRLVLAMTVFPNARPGALFSDAADYRFRIDQPFADGRVDEPVPTIASLRLAPNFWEWRFDLRTGRCLDADGVTVQVHTVTEIDGLVLVAVPV